MRNNVLVPLCGGISLCLLLLSAITLVRNLVSSAGTLFILGFILFAYLVVSLLLECVKLLREPTIALKEKVRELEAKNATLENDQKARDFEAVHSTMG